MAYNEPLGKQVERKKDAYYNNPQALEQRVQQNNDLLGVLALQRLKTQKEAAKRELMLAQQQNSGTIAEQLEREHLEGNRESIAEAVSQVGGVMKNRQAQQQGNLQRAAQGAVPPPQAAAQGVAPPPNVANTGIAAAPRTPMRMAQGGVIGFQTGRIVDQAGARAQAQQSMRERFLAQDSGELSAEEQALFEKIPLGKYLRLPRARQDALLRLTPKRRAELHQRETLLDTQQAARDKPPIVAGQSPAAARQEPKVIPAAAVVPMGTTQGGIGEDQWGAELDIGATSLVPPPSPPPTGAEVSPFAQGPQLTPLQIAQKQAEGAGTLPKGLGQLSPDAIAASQRKNIAQVQKSDLLTKAGTAAERMANINPAIKRNEMNRWMQRQIGVTPAEETAEAGMQSNLAKLLYARQRAGERAGNRTYLSNMARGDISAASDARQAVMDAQMAQGIAGVEKIQGQKRAFSKIKRAANQKAAEEAAKAYEIAGERQRDGVTALSTIAAKDQDRLSADAKAMNEMKESNIKHSWEASVHNATQEVKVAIAEAAAEIAEARLNIDVEMKLLEAGQLSTAKKEKLLVDIHKNMASAREKIIKIYTDAKGKIVLKDDKSTKEQEEALDREMNTQLHIQLKPMHENMQRVQRDLGHLKVRKKS